MKVNIRDEDEIGQEEIVEKTREFRVSEVHTKWRQRTKGMEYVLLRHIAREMHSIQNKGFNPSATYKALT